MGLGSQVECEVGVFISLIFFFFFLLSDRYELAAFLYPVTLQKVPVTSLFLCLSGLEVVMVPVPEDPSDL